MDKNLDSEVIIVGAGPAGISAAKILIENGIKVLLIDKAEFPRRKPCASALSYRALKEFPYVKEFIDCMIYSVSIHSSDQSFYINSSTEDLDSPFLGLPTRRMDFDNNMLEMIKKMDCKVITGEEVINIENNSNHAKIYTNKGNTYTSLAVIGADSAVSKISKARKIGFYNPSHLSKKRKALNYAIEQEVHYNNTMPHSNGSIDPRTVRVLFHFNDVKGYTWHFPRSIGTNIGVFTQITQGHETIDVLKKFGHFLIKEKYVPKEITEEILGSIKFIGAVLPASKPYKNLTDDRIILIGDAGGFCSPLTGEGIYFSMKSGKIAGDLLSKYVDKYRILKNKSKNEQQLRKIFSKNNLKEFNKQAKKLVGEELSTHYFARKIFIKKKHYDRALRWAKDSKSVTDLIINFMLGKESYKYIFLKLIVKVLKSKIKRKK
jgi:geranylgeranyl reductase family protein